MRHHLFLKFLHILRHLRSDIAVHLLHQIHCCQMKLRILDQFLSVRQFFLILTNYKLFQLNPDLLLYTNIHCQCIHAHCIQVCKKSKSGILFNLGNSYMITIFCKRLCLFLCRLFLIINQNLVIKCLFITENKRHLRHT